MSYPEHVLVCADGSADSLAAAAHAARVARASGGRATVLSVVLVPPSVLDLVDRDAVADALDGTARAMSVDAVAVLREAGVPTGEVHRRIAMGSVAREVVAVAAELGCDLVVLGSHGAGRIARAVLGSVSSRVAATAPCPVTVVPHGDVDGQ